MTRLEQLKKRLKPGHVYRRADLAQWSKSVDRHARGAGRTGDAAEAPQRSVLLSQGVVGIGRRYYSALQPSRGL